MSELKAHRIDNIISAYKIGKAFCMKTEEEVYIKSETDKVIAELNQKINEAQTELELWRDGSIISEAHQKELDGKRHSDYKRCLAMARWCNSEMGRETFACFKPRHTKEVWREEHKYWAKWRKIWFELYKKFKGAP